MSGQWLQLGLARFLPHSSQLIAYMIFAFYFELLTASLNKLQINRAVLF
jgi:hypothetical protein